MNTGIIRSSLFVDEVVTLLTSYYSERDNGILGDLALSETKLKESVTTAISSENELIIGYFGRHKDQAQARLLGILWVTKATTFFSDETFLSDKVSFIYPQYRGKGIFTELLNFSKHIAREEKCKFIMLSSLSQREGTDKMYDEKFRYVGSIYTEEL